MDTAFRFILALFFGIFCLMIKLVTIGIKRLMTSTRHAVA